MSTPHLYIRNYHLYLNNVNIPLYIIIAYYFDYLLMNDVQKPPFLQYLRIPKRVQVPFSAFNMFLKTPENSVFPVFFTFQIKFMGQIWGIFIYSFYSDI